MSAGSCEPPHAHRLHEACAPSPELGAYARPSRLGDVPFEVAVAPALYLYRPATSAFIRAPYSLASRRPSARRPCLDDYLSALFGAGARVHPRSSSLSALINSVYDEASRV